MKEVSLGHFNIVYFISEKYLTLPIVLNQIMKCDWAVLCCGASEVSNNAEDKF